MGDGYQLTVSGLLRKRRELQQEAEELRSRLAEVSNDLNVIERAIAIIGHDGALPDASPRATRIALFVRGELKRFIRDTLAKTDKPLRSREIAALLFDAQGRDFGDRRVRNEIVKRVGKALSQMAHAGIVVKDGGKNRGDWVWSLTKSEGRSVLGQTAPRA